MEESLQVELRLISEFLQFPDFEVCHPICHQINQSQIGTISFNQSALNEHLNLKLKRQVSSATVSAVAERKLKLISKPKMNAKPATLTVDTASVSANSKVDVSSMMKVVQSMDSNDKTYQCSFCGSQTSLLSSMKRHIECKHLPSTVVFNCRSCAYSSKYKHDLKKHYIKVHNMPEPAAQGMMIC